MINRVLLYNSGGGIGDALQILPLINGLKNEFKKKNIRSFKYIHVRLRVSFGTAN